MNNLQRLEQKIHEIQEEIDGCEYWEENLI
jgi:hypothetical protein